MDVLKSVPMAKQLTPGDVGLKPGQAHTYVLYSLPTSQGWCLSNTLSLHVRQSLPLAPGSPANLLWGPQPFLLAQRRMRPKFLLSCLATTRR